MNPMAGIIILGVMCLGLLGATIAIVVHARREERWDRIMYYYRSDE
jgi:hypothetical protein